MPLNTPENLEVLKDIRDQWMKQHRKLSRRRRRLGEAIDLIDQVITGREQRLAAGTTLDPLLTDISVAYAESAYVSDPIAGALNLKRLAQHGPNWSWSSHGGSMTAHPPDVDAAIGAADKSGYARPSNAAFTSVATPVPPEAVGKWVKEVRGTVDGAVIELVDAADKAGFDVEVTTPPRTWAEQRQTGHRTSQDGWRLSWLNERSYLLIAPGMTEGQSVARLKAGTEGGWFIDKPDTPVVSGHQLYDVANAFIDHNYTATPVTVISDANDLPSVQTVDNLAPEGMPLAPRGEAVGFSPHGGGPKLAPKSRTWSNIGQVSINGRLCDRSGSSDGWVLTSVDTYIEELSHGDELTARVVFTRERSGWRWPGMSLNTSGYTTAVRVADAWIALKAINTAQLAAPPDE